MNIDAVVLAGGDAAKVDPSFSGPKSLIEINGRPMIAYVMDALGGCRELRRVVTALPEGAKKAEFNPWVDDAVEGTTTVIDAIAKAIAALGPEGYLLIVSSDAPMIHSRAINAFIDDCRSEQADLYYSVVRSETTEAAFPATRRTYIKLRDGHFTGGNIHMVDKSAFLRNREEGERIFSLRKHPIAMVGLLGLGFVVKYIAGRLDVETLELTAGKILGAKVKTVIAGYPELGVDVDKPEDLVIAHEYFADKV